MTWVKMDDAFADHPKVMALGRDRIAGLGVWVAAACYSARFLTDGFVPTAVASSFGHAKTIGRLVEVGLMDAVPGGYRLHDWLDYNPPRDKVLADRKAAKDRMNKARGSGDVQPNNRRTDEEQAAQFVGPVPVPGPQPVPDILSNVLSNGSAAEPWMDPLILYAQRAHRKKLSTKEQDWIEDLHVRFSRTDVVRALYAVEPGTDYLKRVDAFLEGAA